MTDALELAGWLLLRGLAAIALILAAVALARRRPAGRPGPVGRSGRSARPAASTQPQPGEVLVRQAWASAIQAHARLARLEDRVRDLEHTSDQHAASRSGDPR